MQEWELLVLRVLNWDLAAVTPYTILNQLLTHQILQPQTKDIRLKKIAKAVQRHTLDLITMSTTESSSTRSGKGSQRSGGSNGGGKNRSKRSPKKGGRGGGGGKGGGYGDYDCYSSECEGPSENDLGVQPEVVAREFNFLVNYMTLSLLNRIKIGHQW